MVRNRLAFLQDVGEQGVEGYKTLGYQEGRRRSACSVNLSQIWLHLRVERWLRTEFYQRKMRGQELLRAKSLFEIPIRKKQAPDRSKSTRVKITGFFLILLE